MAFVFVDSDGHVGELIPQWIEAGVDGTYPVEAAAQQDIVEYAGQYPEFRFHGGIDKRRLSKGFKEVEEEVIPKAKKLFARGGWIPSVDHAVPADVPFENFGHMIRVLKDVFG